MYKPDPPLVTFNEITRKVDIRFDADFEFTPEAAERIDAYMRSRFPVCHIMEPNTLDDMEAVAAQLQREAFERGEMTLKDPIGLAARRQAALDKLKSMPPIMESILAAPLNEDNHEPGELIGRANCPHCRAALGLYYGNEPGEIMVVGESEKEE